MAEMRFDTTRSDEQRRRMQKCKDEDTCYFCERLKNHELVLFENDAWFVIKNDFAYEDSVHQYLLICKRHIHKISACVGNEGNEFIEGMLWIEKHLQVLGYSFFGRCGDMQYTHASLDHLHIQFLSGIQNGENSEKMKVTLAYKKKPR